MKYLQYVLALSLALLFAGPIFAADPAPPENDGYKIVEEAVVTGQFKGCTAQVGIPMNNKLFICTTFGFSPTLYYPKAIIFKNQKDEYKVLINGTEYKGYFYKGDEGTTNK